MRVIIFSAVMAVSSVASAEQLELAAFEPMLLPIAVRETPGAHGSLWQSAFWLMASGDASAGVMPFGPVDRLCELCPPPVPIPLPTVPPPAGMPFRPALYWSGPSAPPGILFYVSRQDAHRVHLSLQVRDRNSEKPAATVIPVVRERDLRGDLVSILNVPHSADLRSILRIYDIGRNQGGQVRIRFSSSRSEILYETVVSLTLNATTKRDLGIDFPLHPAYAQMDIPALESRVPPQEIHVEVFPLSPGLRLWAFVTTANERNELEIFVPQ